jgi:stage II sporulation protein M
MSNTSNPDNNTTNRYYKLFSGLYYRNKNYLILSAALFFLSLGIGLFLGYFLPSSVENFLITIVKTDRMFVRQNGITTLSILTHNLYSVLITYIGGLIGVITAGILFLNGFIYGSFLGYFASNHHITSSSIGNVTPQIFLLYTIPHGIFEITGFIIAGAAGFRLTKSIIDILRSNDPASEYYWEIKDSLYLLGIAIILIVIAAIIEANITLNLGNYIIHR